MTPAAMAPRGTLVLLTLVVLAAHLLVLQGEPPRYQAGDSRVAPVPLQTRTLVPLPQPPATRPDPPPTPARAKASPARPPAMPATPSATPADPVGANDTPIEPQVESSVASGTDSAAVETRSFVAGPMLPPPAALPVTEPAPPAPPPPSATAGDRWPARVAAPQRLVYEVSGEIRRLPYTARSELLWQHDGAQYRARLEVGALFMGSRVQTSEGRLDDHGLSPLRFGDRSRQEQAAHFDAASGRIRFSANTPEAALSPGAQDRLSLFLQVGALAAANPDRFAPGSTITVQTASARDADLWVLRVGEPETLDLPAGPVTALALVREPRRPYDIRLELWLAPAMNYLPVRVRLTQANGDFVDQQLRTRTVLAPGF